ncbi:MAG: glycosyltransferase [Acetobacter sp.]|jgi:glycosyltransferase involved in cell wall biosynthesis|nr:glycosyltransferase [Acetobacter sp.]MCH4062437.1 glycosyltransferase [Acetobacter sp.]MCH4088716.1 glycosyltransferase [Acetobacter sp.]MCI1292621.1 glycosyltransferase [Acetobacter sp.]MCI1319279.1 glycosyltransferase [Acetobacter sp.]
MTIVSFSDALMHSTSGRVALWSRFDPQWYRERYNGHPDDLEHLGDAELEAHYHEIGASRGYSPNPFFDELWYRKTYPVINSAIEQGIFLSGFDHYCMVGFGGHSPHWLFSETVYLERNPELTCAVLEGQGYRNGYDHYLACGDREFRSGHLFFNPKFCYNALSNSASRLAITTEDALRDGIFASWLRLRGAEADRFPVSEYFDPVWYVGKYPAAAKAVRDGVHGSALEHYLTCLMPAGLNPNEWFSEEFYAENNPDVPGAVEQGVFRSCYDHFLRFGVFEFRQPHPDLDIAVYARNPIVNRDLVRGIARDAFSHWITTRPARRLPELEVEDLHRYEALAALKAESLTVLAARRPLDFTSQEAPLLTVLLSVKDRFPVTLATLAAIRSGTHKPIQVIVVDRGSVDETLRINRYAKGITVLRADDEVSEKEIASSIAKMVASGVLLKIAAGFRPADGVLDAVMDRFAQDSSIGVVTGKVIRADGRIYEAGTLVFRDGSMAPWLEGFAASVPEADYRRSVVCGTSPCLAIRSSVLEQVGGFGDHYLTDAAKFTDFCLKASASGYKSIYEPDFVVFADVVAGHVWSIPDADIHTLRVKHAAQLSKCPLPSPSLAVHGRDPQAGKRILYIEDQIPLRQRGSGFTRSNDIIRTMAELGYHVSVMPVYADTESPLIIRQDFPETVEVFHDRGYEQLGDFLTHHNRYYDCIWIARTHNAERLLPVLKAHAGMLPPGGIILDTEAVVTSRQIQKAALVGDAVPDDEDELLRREFSFAWLCQTLVAVSPSDAALIRKAGFPDVAELGHLCTPRRSRRSWSMRRDILFVGAIHHQDSPNYDSLIWFCENVLPLLDAHLPQDVRLTIAGFNGPGVRLHELGQYPRVVLAGAVDDPAELYESHRVFVAPTRYAAGIPYKIHEAASYGLPVVATDLLCRQLGWQDGVQIADGGMNDPALFADQIVRLYRSEELWNTLRDGALRAVEEQNSKSVFQERLSAILKHALSH